MKLRASVIAVLLAIGTGISPAWADPFFFTTGNADGLLGALSGESPSKIETETADDFVLAKTTVISGATITGLINAPRTNISNVEVEVYHVFGEDPQDKQPPSGKVPSRTNSPSDNEIDSATRDSGDGTLSFSASSVSASFSVANTVVNGINPIPLNRTFGEGAASGEEVQITITFDTPIVLPAGHYFFRPEVLVNGGDFLYLSAPRPMVAPPATQITPDLQAWIRNANLAPDWLRIGTDIIDVAGATGPTFNMTYSLAGNTIPAAGVPGDPSCHGDTIYALA
ncbi:MAG TPA: hypothetical protein VFJ20_05780, partial [Gemmatimonadaceae bacterium]|nr:hypothetical protein [Gemmatimonadaceae bacterium]